MIIASKGKFFAELFLVFIEFGSSIPNWVYILLIVVVLFSND